MTETDFIREEFNWIVWVTRRIAFVLVQYNRLFVNQDVCVAIFDLSHIEKTLSDICQKCFLIT